MDAFEQTINTPPVEWPKVYDGDLRTLDIVKLFASGELLIREGGDQSTVLCPWRDEHTTGDSGTAIWRNADGYPGFHCLHQHCKDRGIQDVLAWFGRSAVDAHCMKGFANPEVVRERERLTRDADLAEQIVAQSQVKVVAPSLEVDPEASCEVDDFMDKPYKPQDAPAASTYRFKPLSASDFAQATYSLEWLVTNMLVKNQPCIIGGPKKALKTSILVDLAISLGSGEPFLGYFPLQRTRTVLISGESGDFTLQETANRVCLAKSISLADTDTLWDFRLPQLSVPEQLDELKRGLDCHRVEVAIIDPLYLCLLAGQSEGKSASNLFDMGPLLMQVSRACLDVGCTPLLVHHAKKFTATGEALDLEALAFAGVQEFARQWLLLSRREAYQPGTGVHRLYLSAGGSAGQSSLHGLDVYEGVLSSDFTGRTWKVEVLNLDKVKERKAKAAELLRQEKVIPDQNALLKVLDDHPTGITKTKLKTALPWGDNKFYTVLTRMQQQQLIRLAEGEITVGKGAKRKVEMVFRVGSSDTNIIRHGS